ncbi:MAG: metabolite traffic protein EboE [Planctomycetota bacterium]
MRDVLGEGTVLCYGTNALPNQNYDSYAAALVEVVPAVRDRLGLREPLAIGVSFPSDVEGQSSIRNFGRLLPWLRFEWVDDNRAYQAHSDVVDCVTANSFAFHYFHDTVVKKNVYEPDWTAFERVFHDSGHGDELAMLPFRGGSKRSISTLPIAFGTPGLSSTQLRKAVSNLEGAVAELRDLAFSAYSKLDPVFTLDLEPEPGCILDTADDVISFFSDYIPEEHRQHIGICHDVCHSAVMFEDQRAVLRRYAEAGIRVNKVQISSALEVNVAAIGPESAAERLAPFNEPRYLHQTGFTTGDSFQLHEDLPDALAALARGDSPDTARTHFHVPIYLDEIDLGSGPITTTNDQIADAIKAAREYHDCKIFEVETYSWSVLPEPLRQGTLAESIARELLWVKDLAQCENIT